MILKIEVFGAFRDYFRSGYIEIECEAPIAIADIKRAIIHQGHDNPNLAPLINSSAIATNDTILNDIDLIDAPIELMILPPVSGGI